VTSEDAYKEHNKRYIDRDNQRIERNRTKRKKRKKYGNKEKKKGK
jgi:hypothetical protein